MFPPSFFFSSVLSLNCFVTINKQCDYNHSLHPFNRDGVDSLTIIFPCSEKRVQFENALVEAKVQLAASVDKRPPPEFLYPVPIRKTRAGLQFTCAACTIGYNSFGYKDVWVCNSDGYVGQVRGIHAPIIRIAVNIYTYRGRYFSSRELCLRVFKIKVFLFPSFRCLEFNHFFFLFPPLRRFASYHFNQIQTSHLVTECAMLVFPA